ncbi:GNAT family N-acetyltransferase [Streptomyces otsuchiensis]|uniref:GNAT family N-acetyltransferase n=1 Tax=Streptomyces otsuchiensis TaxID=2681388 RepID=UPI0010316190|nr:GNAT family N-acetyltransferase [Streptomyces otsuchiensis]
MEIRRGGPGDIPAVLAMLDSAVAWLGEQGRTGQWGTEPWSERPSAVEKVTARLTVGETWIAEPDDDGTPAGALTLSSQPQPYVDPVDEPEIYVQLLVTHRAFAGRGVGAALLEHAVSEARRRGVELLRVDCYAGDDGRLVRYYRGQGFEPAHTFTVGEWPGQLLTRRV